LFDLLKKVGPGIHIQVTVMLQVNDGDVIAGNPPIRLRAAQTASCWSAKLAAKENHRDIDP
jgi:hypothetical protein